jgi:NAD+ kinase
VADPRLLVVYKKSQLELYREHDPEAGRVLSEREPELWERFTTSHDQNALAIERVTSAIRERSLTAEFVYRADTETADGFDLVISVGGDGTLLDVSHSVFSKPLLGVISSESSVGYFCGTDASGFADTLDGWLGGQRETTDLTRLQVSVNGTAYAIPILNEVLYSAIVPASVSRYVMRVGDIVEEHKSSGIWISTAAGSTAAIRSAGGQLMEPSDTRIQYIVREPFLFAGIQHQLTRDIVDQPIEVMSKMRTAAIYVDGHREQIWLSLGDRVRIDRHPYPLRLVGFTRRV